MIGSSGTASAGLTTRLGTSLFAARELDREKTEPAFVHVVTCGNGWKPSPNSPVAAQTLANCRALPYDQKYKECRHIPGTGAHFM